MSELLDAVLGRLRVTGGPNDRGDYTAWCPFHEDGQGTPPHKADLRVGATGFTCHACGEKGGLRKLAAKLGMAVPESSRASDPTYDYCDEDGKLLFQVVRSPGKKFWQRRPDGKGGWIKNLKGVSRVPYRLRDLASRPNDRVYLVEGEKDADRLVAVGLLATTTGSASSWKRKYTPYFANRDVVILPDNDDAGRGYAAAAAADLVGKAASVKVVALPGLPPAGDISDWLDGGHTPVELEELSAPVLEGRRTPK